MPQNGAWKTKKEGALHFIVGTGSFLVGIHRDVDSHMLLNPALHFIFQLPYVTTHNYIWVDFTASRRRNAT